LQLAKPAIILGNHKIYNCIDNEVPYYDECNHEQSLMKEGRATTYIVEKQPLSALAIQCYTIGLLLLRRGVLPSLKSCQQPRPCDNC